MSTANRLLVRGRSRLKREVAAAYRGALPGVVFMGITGSCGKTTSKELIRAVLGRRYSGRTSDKLTNGPERVAETLLTVLPWHRFCVHELCGARPGGLAPALKVLRPQIGLVTHVGQDHYTNFRGLDATAAEKGTLIAGLPADGVALLNADDPRVLAMRARTQARVLTYGLGDEAMVRGTEVASAWPDRLSLTASYEGEEVHVQTQLLGEHWAHSVLAALATGVAFGLSLSEGAAGVATVPPVPLRMAPVRTPDGMTFVVDTWKAPLWTIPASLRFLQTARARRKILVIGTVSDYPGESSQKYRSIARRSLEAVDRAIFVGDFAHCALKARSHPDDERIQGFATLYEASRFLRSELLPGDLVLLKGSHRVDHLERLVVERTGDLACWRVKCGLANECSCCTLRSSAFVPVLSGAADFAGAPS